MVDKKKEGELIEIHSELVRRIACYLIAKLPAHVQLEDLIQAGMIGLIEAIRKYNDTKGASFVTYAGIRIRGAMIDELRKGDWTPRSVHRYSRMIAKASKEIENQQGRNARPQEIMQNLGLSHEKYFQCIQDHNNTRVYAFEELDLHRMVINSYAVDPIDSLQAVNLTKNLASELSKLPDKEKLVVSLYYHEELNLKAVGEILGVTESRVSQIHAKAMSRLQGRMKVWENRCE